MFALTRSLCFPAVLLIGLLAQALPNESLVPVEGSVTNKLTGAPIKGAHVIYTRIASAADPADSPISRDSDLQGHFHIELAPGSYRLWVEREGFARQHYGSAVPESTGTVLTVAPGQELHDLMFRVTPLGALSGRIFDQDGDPLQGVGVQVMRVSYSSGMRQLIPVAGASSNDRGEYRCYDLPADRYFILATPKGSPLSHPVETGALVPEMQDAFVPLYYPGVLELESASAVPLPEGGDIQDINFRMQSVRASTVRGRVLSPLKSAQNLAQVVLAHNDHGFASYIDRSTTAVDPDTGKFEIRRVAPGSYFLVASQLIKGEVFSARLAVEITPGTPTEEVTLPLAPGVTAHGSIMLESTAPLPSNLVVRLQQMEGLLQGPAPAGTVGSDGSMLLPGVAPGMWALSVEHLPESMWIKSVAFGDIRATSNQLSLPPGARGPLRIVLAENGAQVSGVVEKAGDQSPATVVLVPEEIELRLSPQAYRFSQSDSRGAFLFKGVRPGGYRLFAFESIAPFAWMDPAILSGVEELGQVIVVKEGERSAHQLTPIPYAAVLPSR